MRDWLTYQLSDFLLFSERVYWRLFVLENAERWPLALFAQLIMVSAVGIYFRRPDFGLRVMSTLLGLAIASTSWHFVWQRYAPINWAIHYAIPLFVSQAVIFGMIALRPLPVGYTSQSAKIIGFALLLIAIVAYPLLAPLYGRSIASAEVFGIAPDPTVVAAIGVTFLIKNRWYRHVLVALSLAWIGQSTITLFVLDQRAALPPAIVLMIGLLGHVLLAIKPCDELR